ncbi:zinc ribbon domain-containing protein [Halalkalibacter krulwichiae]|uniref:zinc ribbon domain-containing protein n=1 Tax=Halalkalibacter krulwichiae TaxID=199441 RepID=UPI00350E4140
MCGHCGSPFGRKVWNSTDERLRRIVWRCNGKYSVKGEKSCQNKHIDDKVLYQAFINTFNAIIENKDYFLEKWQQNIDSEDYLQKYRVRQFIELIEKAEPITEFDLELYFTLIRKFTVFEGERIVVSLLDETEIECEIE